MNPEELKELENNLWKSADTLRANSDLKSSEYSTPVLGLIFLKFADNRYKQYESEILAEYEELKGTRRDKPLHDIAVGEAMSSQALYDLVIKYGKMIGKQLQPHDLRRTGAQIAWKAGVPIEQISLSLGHESIETTSLYLGIERDWEKQPADFIPY